MTDANAMPPEPPFPEPPPALSRPVMGSAAMIGKDTVLVSGGVSSVHMSGCQTGDIVADTWKFSYTNPDDNWGRWTQLPPMARPRSNHYLVALPDGTVMALGGTNLLHDGDPPSFNPPVTGDPVIDCPDVGPAVDQGRVCPDRPLIGGLKVSRAPWAEPARIRSFVPGLDYDRSLRS